MPKHLGFGRFRIQQIRVGNDVLCRCVSGTQCRLGGGLPPPRAATFFEPCAFLGLGAMDVTKPDKFIWYDGIHGPKPHEFIRFRWAFISQTPVVLNLCPAPGYRNRSLLGLNLLL